jgi:hypothetical protein
VKVLNHLLVVALRLEWPHIEHKIVHRSAPLHAAVVTRIAGYGHAPTRYA